MRSSIIPGALSALTMFAAQAQNFTLDPKSVDDVKRHSWCQAQINNCMLLCGGSFALAPTDTCDSNTLKYDCLCSNGTAPGLEYYTGTMPTFICTQVWENCNAANENNAQGQANCTKTIKDHCGTLTPAIPSGSSSGSSGSSSASAPSGSAPTGSSNSSASGSAAGPSAAASSAVPHSGANVNHVALLGNGAAVVAAGILAALHQATTF